MHSFLSQVFRSIELPPQVWHFSFSAAISAAVSPAAILPLEAAALPVWSTPAASLTAVSASSLTSPNKSAAPSAIFSKKLFVILVVSLGPLTMISYVILLVLESFITFISFTVNEEPGYNLEPSVTMYSFSSPFILTLILALFCDGSTMSVSFTLNAFVMKSDAALILIGSDVSPVESVKSSSGRGLPVKGHCKSIPPYTVKSAPPSDIELALIAPLPAKNL